ncbi:hypothetical protein, partial [uncultured Porphyromonas sp.]|uniref:hypothetical protein n=1 Tax=uncultured Porphyromonas sp. TaxID=159274 RepID=UPI002804F1D8
DALPLDPIRATLQRITCHAVIRRALRPSVPTAGYLSCCDTTDAQTEIQRTLRPSVPTAGYLSYCDTTDALPLDPIRATLQDGGDKRRGRPPTVCGDLPREVFTVLRP